MLTPQEITEKVFVKAVFGGYDMTGVDDFLETLSADYAALYKENAILKGKLKVLVEKVEEYRSTEDAMRMALLTAQRMGEEITVEAGKQRDETLRNADMEARTKLAETTQRIADEEWRLSVAAKETARYIQLSQAIMQKHSEFLTKLETARRTVRPDNEPAPLPPTQEEKIADVAQQIGNAVEKITNITDFEALASEQESDQAANSQRPVVDIDEDEETKTFMSADESDSVSPRPKFDFEDLKFGANFDKN